MAKTTAFFFEHRLVLEDFWGEEWCLVQDLFMRMTLDSTAKLGFGVDLGCLSPSLPAVPFAAAFDRANELSYHRYIDLWWKLKRRLKIREEKELDDCVKVIDSFSYDVIRKRREDMNTSEIVGKTVSFVLTNGNPTLSNWTGKIVWLAALDTSNLCRRARAGQEGWYIPCF